MLSHNWQQHGLQLTHVLSRSLITLTCSANLIFCANASAEQDSQTRVKQLIAMDLGELLNINIATGTPKELTAAPAVVSIVTEEDILATGARTLAEALEAVPGLHVTPSLFRLQKMFNVRGIQNDSTPQILVLLDGNRIDQITSSSTPIGFHYPSHAIKRIEVIRGPGSAVYGADAFSGVINIITKKYDDIHQNAAGITAGSFESTETWLTASTRIGQVELALLADYETSGSDKDRKTQYGSLKTDTSVQNLHINAQGDNWSMTNWYYYVERFMAVGAGIWSNNEDKDTNEIWNSKFDYGLTLNEETSLDMDVSFYRLNNQARFILFPPGTFPVGFDGNLLAPPFLPVSFPDGVIGRPGGTQTRYESNLALIYQPSKAHRLRIAGGGSTTKLKANESKNFGPGILDGDNYQPISNEIIDVTDTPFVYLPDYQRDLWYVSFQDEWKISGQIELTVGIRYDHYSDFGSTTNPRLALVWKANEATTAKFLYGSAFRVATATEALAQNNPATLGNPNINPENIKTSEVVVDHRFNQQLASTLNLYYYEAEDLIALNQFNVNENIGRQKGKGIELELRWQPSPKLNIKGHISLQSTQESINDADKALVPNTMAHLDFRYGLGPRWQLNMQNYWISDRKREMGDNREKLDDYLKTDVNLIYQYDNVWRFQLQVKNVFDETIKEPAPNSGLFALSGLGTLLGLDLPDLGFPDDFPMQGRAIYGSLEYRF